MRGFSLDGFVCPAAQATAKKGRNRVQDMGGHSCAAAEGSKSAVKPHPALVKCVHSVGFHSPMQERGFGMLIDDREVAFM